jgi:hypothetical protein
MVSEATRSRRSDSSASGTPAKAQLRPSDGCTRKRCASAQLREKGRALLVLSEAWTASPPDPPDLRSLAAVKIFGRSAPTGRIDRPAQLNTVPAIPQLIDDTSLTAQRDILRAMTLALKQPAPQQPDITGRVGVL